MINVTFTRDKGHGEVYVSKREYTPAKALNSLLIYEIGYGGKITVLEKTKVTVVTYVLSCRDTTEFEGTEEEMAVLVKAAAISMMVNPMREGADETYKQQTLDRIMEFTKGNPLLLKLSGGILAGETTVRATLLGMLINENNVETVVSLGSIQNKDLFSIVELVHFDNISLEDALELQK